jgi:hypothetical protein
LLLLLFKPDKLHLLRNNNSRGKIEQWTIKRSVQRIYYGARIKAGFVITAV